MQLPCVAGARRGDWTTPVDPVHGPLQGPPLILRDNAHKMVEGE